MIKLSEEELKKYQLDILNATVGFCKQNNINYWLDFGTLLGAIRHKGFISWDDDIDISMLRSDYDKFLELFNRCNERYKVYSYENNKKFYFAYAKIIDTATVLYEPDDHGKKLSVNIDLFVYDNAPEEDKKCKQILRRRNFYNNCEFARYHRGKAKGNIIRRMAVVLLKIFSNCFPKDFFVKKVIKNAKRYERFNTDRVCDFCGSTDNFICPRAIISDFQDGLFEGRMYKIPKDYDKLLQLEYGDYMQLPPPEKRISTHKFVAYIL